jgi:bacteriocin-like protein
MTEFREIDQDEMAQIDGGYITGSPWCGFHGPGWRPPTL